MAVGPAIASGSATGSFSQSNPGKTSKEWTDHQTDNAATKIAYSFCSYSNGEAVTSLTVELWDQWGALPDAKVGNAKNTSGCGSVSWAKSTSTYTMRDSTFFWRIDKMNNSYSNRWMSGDYKATY